MEDFDTNRTNISTEETPSGTSSFGGLLLGLAYLFITPTIVYSILQIFLGSPITEFSTISLSIICQSIAAIGTIVGMFFITKHVFKTVVRNFSLKSALVALICGVVIFFASQLVSILEEALFHPETENQNQNTLNILLMTKPVLGLFFTCLFAPIIEELIFRFYIFGPMKKRSIAWAYILSALSFALVHFTSTLSEFAISNDISIIVNDLKTLPSYLIGGILLCFVYHKTEKISCSIIAHITYNTIVTVILLVSFGKAPLTLKECRTDNNTITIKYKYNLETEVRIDKVEVFKQDEMQEELVLVKTIEQVDLDFSTNKGELTVTDLDSYYVYSINFTYTYATKDENGQITYKTAEISTYAIPMKKGGLL